MKEDMNRAIADFEEFTKNDDKLHFKEQIRLANGYIPQIKNKNINHA